MIGRHLPEDERKNAKLGLALGLATTPFFALVLARNNGKPIALVFVVVMAVIWVAIGLQVRASRLRDEKMNG